MAIDVIFSLLVLIRCQKSSFALMGLFAMPSPSVSGEALYVAIASLHCRDICWAILLIFPRTSCTVIAGL